MRGRLLSVLLILGILFATWFVVRAVEARRFGNDLLKARRDFEAGRFEAARKSLVELARIRPGEGEVEFLLGACEMVKGHADAAMTAWGRVPDRSPLAPAAALARGRRALDIGRYRLAEICLDRASRGGGDVGIEAERLLEWLMWMMGRREDYKKLLQRKVERTSDPSSILRTLWAADFDPYPVDGMTRSLKKANESAPDDDRVWLGLADLATRTAQYQEAGAWLDRCERAQPDDPTVWLARLRWAEAAGRFEEVERAATHLSPSRLSRQHLLTLRAELAARNSDAPSERASLEELVAIQPGADRALERLADLAAQAGEGDRVAELRRRKATIDAARDHYRALINLADMAPHASEFARVAESIGRWFDAQAWWSMAVRRDPSLASNASTAIARLSRAESVAEAGSPGAEKESPRTLADLIGPIRAGKTPMAVNQRGPSIPIFVDEAERRGIVFRFDNGCTDLRQIPETMSGGVGVLDFDGDGWLDVYAVQGGPFPPPTASPPFHDRLFRNRGDGRFTDATEGSGLARLSGGYGHGIAVGDYDNDGRPDLFVTRWRSYALYHNLGDGRFEDATARAGLGGDRDWPTSAAWADLDNDGDLDLYVCHYLKWDPKNPEVCDSPDHPGQGHTYCDPRGSPASPDHVFRNDDGRFVDMTREAGIVDCEGRGLGVVAADLDGDGKVDLFVANDTTANYFFRNLGGFRFTEQGMESGLTASAEGGYLAGMGVACGDLDRDGRLDLAVTNFFIKSTTLHHNHGGGVFSDRSGPTGLAAATRQVLGFGLAALDANNDGWCDLVQANGHVADYRPSIPREMPAQLLLGDGDGRFVDVSDRAGKPWQVPRLGRGLAVADLDNDGGTDVLLVGQNGPLALLRNQSGSQCHFLTLALEGTVSNRDGVGARVVVSASGRTIVSTRFGGGSYLSASDPRIHFGIGPARSADRVEVTWPSGRKDVYRNLTADAGYRLREGEATPEPLPGFAAPSSRH